MSKISYHGLEPVTLQGEHSAKFVLLTFLESTDQTQSLSTNGIPRSRLVKTLTKTKTAFSSTRIQLYPTIPQ